MRSIKNQFPIIRISGSAGPRSLWLVLLPLLFLSSHVWAAGLVIDDFAYATSTAARQAWANTSAPAVNTATNGEWGAEQVMVLNCDFTTEGAPTGWDNINAVHLSPWKAAPQNTYLALGQLRAFSPAVALVRDTQSANPQVVRDTIDRHLAWLCGYSISCGVVTRTGVEAGLLAGSRVAILPYNETVSEAEMNKLEAFVAAGGKLIVYYLLPSRLAALLGFRVINWTRGDFAAWNFSDPKITNLPPRVLQASWNITVAQPAGTLNARVTALWEDSRGQNTGQAAWLASDHGFFCSHILLGDDAQPKAYALLALIGSLVPEVYPPAADGAIDQIGRVGPYETYDQAVTEIRSHGGMTLRSALVDGQLAQAETNRALALSARASGAYSQAILAAQTANAHLQEAYLLSLRPRWPEFRGIWEHDATGPYPGNWPRAISALATNGLTAIFPNMLWAGLAHYNSAVLPTSSQFAQYGDQIEACVDAAHKHGLQVHVWKVNWNLLTAPQSFIDEMRAAVRTQVSSTGEPLDWLCPSHPDNFALETNSMLEAVRNYDIDGIHFDYIRYPGSQSCYCSGCAERFQVQTGRTVAQWPADVLAAGSLRNAFLDWRRAQITSLVDAVYHHTKALKPKVQVSAAVFGDAVSAYDGVGQDWRRWITNGIVDFLCPMDYTASLSNFTNLVQRQLDFAAAKVPIYPGIGAFLQETDGTLAQIEATRAAGTGGFVLFELSSGSAATLLPALSKGATAPDETDTDNDYLPDVWEFRWFTNLTIASLATDFDLDGLSDRVEYITGSTPTQLLPQPDLTAAADVVGHVTVSFVTRPADGPGYKNAARHYRLETSPVLAPLPSWTPVPDLEDHTAQASESTVTCSIPPEDNRSRFFRVKVWLQQR
jgi:uncharacterized lipoprotein YddW (UPF0748 family)